MKIQEPFSEAFEVRVPAKWILSGEHSVLRGCPAIGLPLPQFFLTLKYQPDRLARLETLKCEPPELKAVIDPIIEKAFVLSRAQEGMSRPCGLISISSNIPMGSGLGSSAALCVAMTKWLAEPLLIPHLGQQDFATRLEDAFHGKSSGLDIAICWNSVPLLYRRGEIAQVIEIDPAIKASLGILEGNLEEHHSSASNMISPAGSGFFFQFEDSGYRSSTRECILKVEDWISKNAAQSFEVDQRMALATELALKGLKFNDFEALSESFELSWDCFKQWGLLSPGADERRKKLLVAGARAVRITGAGLGGYFVSLWSGKG